MTRPLPDRHRNGRFKPGRRRRPASSDLGLCAICGGPNEYLSAGGGIRVIGCSADHSGIHTWKDHTDDTDSANASTWGWGR